MNFVTHDTRACINRVLDTLAPKEREVLTFRFGLDGTELTLAEISLIWGVSRERIRQIQRKALSKLRHPIRAKRLQKSLDDRVVFPEWFESVEPSIQLLRQMVNRVACVECGKIVESEGHLYFRSIYCSTRCLQIFRNRIAVETRGKLNTFCPDCGRGFRGKGGLAMHRTLACLNGGCSWFYNSESVGKTRMKIEVPRKETP